MFNGLGFCVEMPGPWSYNIYPMAVLSGHAVGWLPGVKAKRYGVEFSGEMMPSCCVLAAGGPSYK